MRSLTALLLAAAAAVASPAHAALTRVSVGTRGEQGDEHAFDASVSAHGRYVVFASRATTLVPRDANGRRQDVFLRDTRTGRTTIVGLSSRDRQVPGNTSQPVISASGRFVAFVSGSRRLVPGDTNGARDVFVRDLSRGTTTRVSVSSSGRQGTRSDREFAYSADSTAPVISGNGRFVAFASIATGLVPRDTNGDYDAFVHDRATGRTTRESLTPSGRQTCCSYSGPTDITPDGRVLVFNSQATNIVRGDTDGPDVFVRDRDRGTTRRVIASDSQGRQSFGGRVSDDGRVVAFRTAPASDGPDAGGEEDVFVYDLRSGAGVRIGGDPPGEPVVLGDIAGGGRSVSFSRATAEGYDAYVRDLDTGETTRVSVGDGGTRGDRGSFAGAFSADGRYLLFSSRATNLVPGDTNNRADVFLTGPLSGGAAAAGR